MGYRTGGIRVGAPDGGAMKILIFIEHDVVIRHFVQSGVFAPLIARHDVIFVFPEPGYKRVTMDVSTLDLGAPYRHLTVHQPRLLIWKRLFQVDLLRWRRGSLFRALRILHREMMGWKAAVFYTFLGLPGIHALFCRRAFAGVAAMPNEDLDRLIEEQAPDLLIHPSVLEGVYINDLVAVSKATDIPLAVIMNSWDNPCTKRAMVGSPDWLLVWGEQTRSHAIEFARMTPERAVMFGAAQFDLYRHPPRIDRAEFCTRHDIDPKDSILLYAGSSKGTDEFSHLMDIEDAIERGDLGCVTVVYRPHPWGGGGKGGNRILDHPWRHVRIESTMRAYLERLGRGDTSSSFPDYRDTHDVLSSIDALVSPLSTIILEGALHGKPTLCFLPVEETGARHFQLALPLKHFEDMFNMPDFLVARGRAEFLPGIVTLLSRIDDDVFAAQLAETCRHFVEPFELPYGDRLVEFCDTATRA
jgi:hypothetical protein